MATNNRYAPYSVKVDAGLYRTTRARLVPNTQVRLYTPDGGVDPTASSLIAHMPTFRFSSSDVGLLLAAIGHDGLDVTTGIEMGWKQRAQGGGFESAGKKESAAKCLIVPEVLAVDQDGDAEISYIGYAYSSDGTTAPTAHADTLPAGTPSVAEMWTLGTVTINGTALKKGMGYRLAFGFDVRAWKQDGNIYATDISIVGRRPVLTVTLADMDEVSAARILGGEVSTIVANVIKRSVTGGGLAGAGDKTITFEKMFATIEDAGGEHGGDCLATWQGRARKGTGAIFVIA